MLMQSHLQCNTVAGAPWVQRCGRCALGAALRQVRRRGSAQAGALVMQRYETTEDVEQHPVVGQKQVAR